MSEIYRKVRVFVCDEYAGILRETEDGYSFSYDKDYLSKERPLPVSLTLKLSDKPYESRNLFPFFDGLIPEGWLYERILHNWKLNRNDRFGMLMVACRDCIGDVSIRPYE